LKECEDETHTPKIGIWESFETLETSEFDCRGQNTLHWVLFISLENYRSVDAKMGLHEPFGHLQHKLWQKERSGIKLAVWLPTTKSRESIRPRCVQGECDTPLESSRQELQRCFRPHPNRRSEQWVIVSQSCGNPNHGSSRTPP
jgi:hypothetical protein